ncbi:MAG: hypothetical protein AAF843_14030 [Bacteroidota bacterium]
MELLKTTVWLLEGSRYISPQLSVYHKHWMFQTAFGSASIDDIVYQEVDYNNSGWFVSVKALHRILGKTQGINGVYMGLGLGISDYTEKGDITFGGNYFDDFRATLKQQNRSYFVQWSARIKQKLGDKWIIGQGIDITHIVNSYNQPEFPVYYVPGSGIVNIFGDRADNESFSFGLSINIGYQIR